MQTFIDFLVNNYFWFLIISLILIFALIGYLVDTSEKPSKIKKEEPFLEQEQKTEQTQPTQEVINTIVSPEMNGNNVEAVNMEAPIPTTEQPPKMDDSFPTMEMPKSNETEVLDDLDNLQ